MRTRLTRALTLALLGVGLVAAARPAEAQTFLGSACWRLDPYVDTLRVSLTAYPDGMYGAFVRWRATGYQFQGSGLLSADSSTPGDWLLTFSAAGTTTNLSCDFRAHLVARTWEYICPSTGFANSGSISLVSPCPGAAAAPQEEGPTSMPPH